MIADVLIARPFITYSHFPLSSPNDLFPTFSARQSLNLLFARRMKLRKGPSPKLLLRTLARKQQTKRWQRFVWTSPCIYQVPADQGRRKGGLSINSYFDRSTLVLALAFPRIGRHLTEDAVPVPLHLHYKWGRHNNPRAGGLVCAPWCPLYQTWPRNPVHNGLLQGDGGLLISTSMRGSLPHPGSAFVGMEEGVFEDPGTREDVRGGYSWL
ncbi:hypothetical protein EDB89DRAFT_1331711 [Lactarius sanguifluus]|nr:hypothetical protein EDB89DRAFT_1331711 [Lactarius sanguifluus]